MNEISQTENKVLMQQARASLKGQWGLAVGTCFLYLVIVGVVESIPGAGPIISLIIAGPMTVGLSIFCLALSRDRNPQLPQLFDGFKKFVPSMGAYLLAVLFIALWAILLIVPGIIAALSYSMIFFIIAEDDAIGPMEALRKSKQMMYGNKWKFFCLGLRFIGWILLGIVTCGIALLWITPYLYVSYAKFYDDLTGASR